MSEQKKSAKEILGVIKKLLFEGMPPAPPATTSVTVKTADGTELSVDKLEVGGMVTVAGVAAPATTYTLEDGATITTDATGKITAYVPKAAPQQQQQPPAQPPAATPPAATPPVQQPAAMQYEITEELMKAEGIQALYAKFAVGTPEERLANMELMMKAVFEYCYGYEIRRVKEEAAKQAAIAIYVENLKGAELELKSHKEKIELQEKVMKEMFALTEELANSTIAEPPGGNQTEKKFSFSKVTESVKGEKRGIARFQVAAKKLQEEYETTNKTEVQA